MTPQFWAKPQLNVGSTARGARPRLLDCLQACITCTAGSWRCLEAEEAHSRGDAAPPGQHACAEPSLPITLKHATSSRQIINIRRRTVQPRPGLCSQRLVSTSASVLPGGQAGIEAGSPSTRHATQGAADHVMGRRRTPQKSRVLLTVWLVYSLYWCPCLRIAREGQQGSSDLRCYALRNRAVVAACQLHYMLCHVSMYGPVHRQVHAHKSVFLEQCGAVYCKCWKCVTVATEEGCIDYAPTMAPVTMSLIDAHARR